MKINENNPISYRRADFHDCRAMSDLRKYFLDPDLGVHRSCEPEYYQWKIFNNPFGIGLAWLAEFENETIGMVSISPRPLNIMGRAVISGELGDGFVHPGFQGRGIFKSLLNNILQDADNLGYELTYGTPTKQAFSVEKKVGYGLYTGEKPRLLVRPLKFRAILSRSRIPRFLQSILSTTGQLLYRLLFPIKPSDYFKISKDSSKYQNVILNSYQKVQRDIQIDISESYINWRYETNPDSYSYGVSHTEDAKNAYGVFKIGHSSGLNVGYIAEYGYTDNTVSLKSLFSDAVAYFNNIDVDLIAVWAGTLPKDIITLRKLGFFLIREIDVIIRPLPNGSIDIDHLSWRFCMADSDNI